MQQGRGHPRNGWISVRQAGRGGDPKPRWFCGVRCLVYALTGTIDIIEPQEGEPPRFRQWRDWEQVSNTGARKLALLNMLAGTNMTVMTATPNRVRAALDSVFKHIVDAVDGQAAKDARGRRTMTEVLAEFEERAG